jgi:hypothetical protein
MNKFPIQESYFSCQTKGDKCNTHPFVDELKSHGGLVKCVEGLDAVAASFFGQIEC